MPLRRALRLVVVLLGCLLAAGLASAPPADARSGGLRPGLGYRLSGGDFVGFYVTADGTKVYCLDPREAEPATVSLARLTRYPGTSRTVTAELAYALARWGDARSMWSAAVESQVVNTLVGNGTDVRRRAASLPSSIAARVAAHVRLARRLHGPYVVHVSVPRAPAPGQSGHGRVWVTSAAGHRVPDVRLALRANAAGAVAAQVHTGADGQATFSYSVVGVGDVRITATASNLPSTAILASRPESYQQHMVTAASGVVERASTSFAHRPNAFTYRYACTSACEGRPSVSLRACAPASTYASRIEYRIGDRTRTVAYPARSQRSCRTVTLTLHDGDHVMGVWRYRIHGRWTRAVAAGGTFTVDCPAVPPVAVSLTYDCAKASVRIALADPGSDGTWTPLVNRSRHAMLLIIGGAAAQRIRAGSGQTAVFTASAVCGAPVTYTAQAAVQRSNGEYNSGPIASITTPGPAAP